MSSLNKVMIIGNLGKDPEVRYSAAGKAMANVTIATSETWKDKQTGEKKEKTEWHRVVFFNRLAEIVGEYLKKGSSVFIEGNLQTRKWQGQDGKDNYTTEIVAREMKMLGGKGNQLPGTNNGQQQGQASNPPQNGNQLPASNDFDDDAPF